MSIITVLYTEQGIVMASDSRITKEIKREDGSLEKFVLTDNVEKIFIIKNGTIGISYCGNASRDNKYIVSFIREFDKKIVKSSDSIKEIVKKLLDYRIEKNIIDTTFYVCGYENEEIYIYLIENNQLNRLNSQDDKYGLSWSGQTVPISKLINVDPSMCINIEMMQLKDAIDFSEFLVDLTIKYEKFEEKLATCGGCIDILVITKEYAKFIKHKMLI